MSETVAIEALLQGGPVAILAYIIFWIYRKDRKSSEDRLTKIIERDQDSREHNTAALTELVVLLKHMNGNS